MGSTTVARRRRLAILGGILAVLCVGAPRLHRENLFSEGGVLNEVRSLPPFPEGSWIGTEPLTLDAMRGRVWVLKVWTFGCINCVRSIPFTNGLAERYGSDVGVLGIHSPEYDWERDLEDMEAMMRKHDVRFPSYIDQSLDYFFALKASGWPAFFVVDRKLQIRGRWIGEIHDGTRRAAAVEELIHELLAE